jgi:hypothetical protein
MKETANQSAALKQQFKTHFREHGYCYIAELPATLATEARAFELEWAEACQEWETSAQEQAELSISRQP